VGDFIRKLKRCPEFLLSTLTSANWLYDLVIILQKHVDVRPVLEKGGKAKNGYEDASSFRAEAAWKNSGIHNQKSLNKAI